MPAGKRCAPMGTLHLPGTLLRSQSAPNMVMTSPTGWAAETQKVLESRLRDFQEHRRQDAKLAHAMAAGTWPGVAAALRPGTSAPLGATGGGPHHGGLDLRPQTTGSSKYDITKHGWYHPLGQAETTRLAGMDKGSWVWTMQKARDHIGYGPDGRVTREDIQITAVSGDNPDWFIGNRTVPGPLTTKKVPVRRCPESKIEGDELRVRAKTYAQGEGLSTIETLHESSRPPTATKVMPLIPPARAAEINKATWNNLIHGGCETRGVFHNNVFPASAHVTYETHDMRGNPANRTLRRKAHGITRGCYP